MLQEEEKDRREITVKADVVSAFCGTGKTYICNHSSKNIVEFENPCKCSNV